MFRIQLVFIMVIFYCHAQAQSDYIISPAFNGTANKPLVVYFSSDGGWHSYDRELNDSLSAYGIPLLGVNAYKYFRKRKTPQQTFDSIMPYISLNLKKYNCKKIILAGYSFGAEVVPFLYNLMSDEWKNKVEFIVLLSPDDDSDFKIHLFDQVGLHIRHGRYDVLSELMKIDNKKIMMFWGSDEKKFVKEKFTKLNITVIRLKGGHRRTNVTPVIAKINEQINASAPAK
jgi:type IV secretory pathway VirJ component